MNELELLSVCLCKGYLDPIRNYLDDCNAKSLDDVRILLKAPILLCVREFNEGYSQDNIPMLNKTMKRISLNYN